MPPDSQACDGHASRARGEAQALIQRVSLFPSVSPVSRDYSTG